MVATQSSSSPKVLVIGLDAGCGRLVQRWIPERCPALGSLVSRGTWGWLETTSESLHVSSWPSIYTGTMPGRHGVYYTFQPAPGLQGYRRFRGDQYGRPTVWRILSQAGKRCVVFDATYTHPERGFQGVQVFDWGTWAWYWRPMSTPTGLLRRLQKECGAYPLGIEANRVGLGSLDPEDLRKRLVEAAAAKTRAALWLMDRQPSDLFFTVFCETHPAGHYGLRSQDPDGEPEELLSEVYREVDRGIGKILERVGEECTVFVVSGDGIGPNRAGWHLLPEVLRRLGFTARRGYPDASEAGEDEERAGGDGPVGKVKGLVPPHLRKAVANLIPNRLRDAINVRMDFAGLDWSRSRAFCLPTDLEGCIRINLRGREPMGIVSPGGEYERVCDELSESLGKLINPRTGAPAVRQVIRVDRSFPGDRRPYLPDLIVLWSKQAEITEVHSEEIGSVRMRSPDGRTGTHSPPGFVIARRPGLLEGGTLEGGHVVDLAPTILTLLGVSPPEHMDGRTWNELAVGL